MSVTSIGLSAISNATALFQRGSTDLLNAVSGASNADAGAAIGEQIDAKAQMEAGVGTVHIADEMFRALIQVGVDTSYSQGS
ncbi:MAG: hypothetical protein ABUL73_04530 [Alphaproteobacteria bacterium]